jgi:hypothetical protein
VSLPGNRTASPQRQHEYPLTPVRRSRTPDATACAACYVELGDENGLGHALPSGDNSASYDVSVADVTTGDLQRRSAGRPRCCWSVTLTEEGERGEDA